MNPASQSLRETCLESLKLIRSSNPSILVIMRVTPEISFRNFEATNGIRDLIHEEVLKLETFYDQLRPELQHVVRSNLAILSLIEPHDGMPDPTPHRAMLSARLRRLEEKANGS